MNAWGAPLEITWRLLSARPCHLHDDDHGSVITPSTSSANGYSGQCNKAPFIINKGSAV